MIIFGKQKKNNLPQQNQDLPMTGLRAAAGLVNHGLKTACITKAAGKFPTKNGGTKSMINGGF